MHRHSQTSKHQVAPGCLKIFIDPSLRIHRGGLLAANYIPPRVALGARAAAQPLLSFVRRANRQRSLQRSLRRTTPRRTPATLTRLGRFGHVRPVRSPLGDDSRRRHASEAPTTTRAGADEVVYRPSDSTTRMTGPLSTGRRPAPASLGDPAMPLPDRPTRSSTSACARSLNTRVSSLPTRRHAPRRRPDHPNLPTFGTAPDTTRTPPRTYLPLDTQARSSASVLAGASPPAPPNPRCGCSASGSAPISRSMSEYHAATVVQSSWRGFKAREGRARKTRACRVEPSRPLPAKRTQGKPRAPPPPTSPPRIPASSRRGRGPRRDHPRGLAARALPPRRVSTHPHRERREPPPMDSNGLSDPYVKVSLVDDDGTPYKKMVHRVPFEYATLNPEWDYSFYMAPRIWICARRGSVSKFSITISGARMTPWDGNVPFASSTRTSRRSSSVPRGGVPRKNQRRRRLGSASSPAAARIRSRLSHDETHASLSPAFLPE